MALNKTLICTQAAFHLGLPRFTNVETETNDRATTMNEIYDWALDLLLRKHIWNFAVKRVELARDVATPASGFTYQYTLPSDYLRDGTMSDSTAIYKIEKGKLLTDETTVKLKYIARITDPGLFDPMFGECLALLIAIKTCMPLTKDANLKNQLTAEYRRSLAEAKRVDSYEGTAEFLNVYGYDESKYTNGSVSSLYTDIEDY